MTASVSLPVGLSGDAPWWRDPVVYQVYLRSFSDSNGDGIGDLEGLRSRLPYLAWLSVDALWITPHYPSGGADGGYDVADYRNVDPVYGDVDAMRALIVDAHQLGLRVLLDVVPNHTSNRHPWFQAALADPNSPEAGYYHFVDNGSDEPPNNWVSLFGGPAWTRLPDGRWYLHLFAPEQPDLNWRNPAVAADFEKTLRFWLDLGVDGFRVDVAYGLFKDPELRDNPGTYSPGLFGHGDEQRYTWGQPEVHEVWRSWRAICDSYSGDRMLVGEVCLADLSKVADYARPDEMQQAFQFRLLKTGWDAAGFGAAITDAVQAFEQVGAPIPWVLGNHDKQRQVTRFGGGAVGVARARAAAMLLLALPGAAYIYAGDELGLPEAFVPPEQRRDPIFFRSGGARVGRDGCRVSMPWNEHEHTFGFTSWGGAEPELPIPAEWRDYCVNRQSGDPSSALELYRAALAVRREIPALGRGRARVTVEGQLLRVELHHSDGAVVCWVNMGDADALLPGGQLLLASDSRTRHVGGTCVLPANGAVWVRGE